MDLDELMNRDLDDDRAMVFLVRHGETGSTDIKGHSDHSINKKGSMQAEIASKSLEDIQPCKILSSDLDRALETAEYFEGDIQTSESLRERNFGGWKGEPSNVFQNALKETNHEQVCPPGGETLAEIYDRVTGYLDKNVEAGEKVICVTHHGPAISLTGYGSDESYYECENGSITAIEMYKDSEELEYEILESNIVPYDKSQVL